MDFRARPRSSAPSRGEGEFLIGGAAVAPVAFAERPPGEQAALDQGRDPRERRARPLGDRAQRADVAAGQRRADEVGALVVDILDAAMEDQPRRLAIAALRSERVGLAEQGPRLARLRPPAL